MLTEQFKQTLNSHIDTQWKKHGVDHAQYQENIPFSHTVLEEFLPINLLKKIVKEFPDGASKVWNHAYQNVNELKMGSSNFFDWGPYTKMVFVYLNSPPFLERLQQLTGIPRLIPDPYYLGGGLHCLPQGGKLNMHVDFNFHPTLNLDRRLNLLIYLNQDWQLEYGGELILQGGEQEVRVIPEFNRAVLFSTTSTSFHGNPNPVCAPNSRTRNSLALYYYTAGRPEGEYVDHSTIFKLQEEQMVAAALQLRNMEKMLVYIKNLVNSVEPAVAIQQIKQLL